MGFAWTTAADHRRRAGRVVRLILAIIMCRAMNRSFSNVLFAHSAGAGERRQSRGAHGAVGERGRSGRDAGFGAAGDFVPGYGLAWRRRSTNFAELYDLLTRRGVDVRFAIHPVAGRMPGT